MVDTIGLVIDQSAVNYAIDFMAEVSAKINVDLERSNEFRIMGTCKNMKVYITPARVHIEGSLPKFRYNSNLITLEREEPGLIIDKLSSILGLPLREAFVTRVDIAANIEVENNPSSYFPYLGLLKNFDRNIRKDTLYFHQNWTSLYFYDKVLEAKKHKDPLLTPDLQEKCILRYEMRFKRQWLQYYFNRKIKAKELYGNASDVCCELIATWYYKYMDIVKSGIMKPRFDLSKNGLFMWLLKDYNRKFNVLKLIEACSEKGDRRAARLKREVVKMLKERDYEEGNMIEELNTKVFNCTEVY